jgi:hypothetical protein
MAKYIDIIAMNIHIYINLRSHLLLYGRSNVELPLLENYVVGLEK